jgi:hypothetical protein
MVEPHGHGTRKPLDPDALIVLSQLKGAQLRLLAEIRNVSRLVARAEELAAEPRQGVPPCGTGDEPASRCTQATFDYLGPDPNDMDGERWDWIAPESCDAPACPVHGDAA